MVVCGGGDAVVGTTQEPVEVVIAYVAADESSQRLSVILVAPRCALRTAAHGAAYCGRHLPTRWSRAREIENESLMESLA